MYPVTLEEVPCGGGLEAMGTIGFLMSQSCYWISVAPSLIVLHLHLILDHYIEHIIPLDSLGSDGLGMVPNSWYALLEANTNLVEPTPATFSPPCYAKLIVTFHHIRKSSSFWEQPQLWMVSLDRIIWQRTVTVILMRCSCVLQCPSKISIQCIPCPA